MPDSFKIDTHVHVFTTDMPLIDNPRHAPKYSFTHEDLIATLDSNGIDRAVVMLLGLAPVGFNAVTFAALEQLDADFAAEALSLSLLVSMVLLTVGAVVLA